MYLLIYIHIYIFLYIYVYVLQTSFHVCCLCKFVSSTKAKIISLLPSPGPSTVPSIKWVQHWLKEWSD